MIIASSGFCRAFPSSFRTAYSPLIVVGKFVPKSPKGV